jgi:hypothetical protein
VGQSLREFYAHKTSRIARLHDLSHKDGFYIHFYARDGNQDIMRGWQLSDGNQTGSQRHLRWLSAKLERYCEYQLVKPGASRNKIKVASMKYQDRLKARLWRLWHCRGNAGPAEIGHSL